MKRTAFPDRKDCFFPMKRAFFASKTAGVSLKFLNNCRSLSFLFSANVILEVVEHGRPVFIRFLSYLDVRALKLQDIGPVAVIDEIVAL